MAKKFKAVFIMEDGESASQSRGRRIQKKILYSG